MDLPDSYKLAAKKMHAAADAWLKDHSFDALRFYDLEGRARREGRYGTEGFGFMLCQVIDAWAGNEITRAFLLTLDRAADGEGTYLMARTIVSNMRDAAKLMEGSAPMTPGGDWHCIACPELIAACVTTEGTPMKPYPGAIFVCAGCAALQKVAAEGNRFVELPGAEFRALTPRMRKHILTTQKRILDFLDKKQKAMN